ncbi:YncE family protein [Swingsia samuiensis]|uniref:YncE family protein n=1 Tax=Swingsia samuiensis TaxID=1293412 RepID=A0A4Y6UL93_9PROT|nr:YncE family protein [Swingsia samuiensis]QDH17226.1 YncE family protein [Swingsia samuiensis]
MKKTWFASLSAALILANTPSFAQTVISANDGHTTLQNAVQVLPHPLQPDSLSILEKNAQGIWHVQSSINVPASVVGPPTALTFTHDGKTALISAAAKPDTTSNKIVPDDLISLIDISDTNKPRLLQQIASAPGVTTMRFTPDGQHLLVANGKSGVLTWFTYQNGKLGNRKVITLPGFGFPSGLEIFPDGKRALVSLWQTDRAYIIQINGDQVTVNPKPLMIEHGPWTIRVTKDGHYALMNLLGHGKGLPGSVVVFNLETEPFKEIQRVTVPNAPEGLDISPDGQSVAVVSQNGSTMQPNNPLYHPEGIVTVFSFSNGHLSQQAQAKGPLWPQGLVFSPDGSEIITQGMMDHSVMTFKWDGHSLASAGAAPLPGGGADIERARP